MLGELKQRLVEARAEAALSLAEVALERGQPQEAARRFLEQAHDLRARGVAQGLQVRAWLGVLRAAEVAALQGAARLPEGLATASAALATRSAGELPPGWPGYEGLRHLLVRLLEEGDAQMAGGLGALLSQWLPRDPRPRYVRARALELEAQRAEAQAASQAAAQRALDALEDVLAVATQVGALRSWEEPVRLRQAALWMRHLAQHQPDALARAARALDRIKPGRVRHLAPAQQLVVAQGWLHHERSMRRLRALDLLGALMEAEPEMVEPSLHILSSYLERMGWDFYGTERDRAVGLLRAHERALGAGRARRALAWLTLLGELREVLGRHGAPVSAHLERLRDASQGGGAGPWAPIYYEVALAVSPGEGWREELGAALEARGAGREVLRRAWRRDVLAWALGALWQRVQADRAQVGDLLDALEQPALAGASSQAALVLLLPVLLARWGDWIELQGRARGAVERFARESGEPSMGWPSLGLALAGLGEEALARQVARRMVASAGQGPPEARRALIHAVARGLLAQGEPLEAARWLLEAGEGGAAPDSL